MSVQPSAAGGQPAQSGLEACEVLSSGKSLYRIHSLWLGPQGWTLPVAIPYAGAAAAGAAFVPALIVLGIVGLTGWQHYAAAAVVAVGAACIVVQNSSSDRPIGALLTTWLHETSGPRPGDGHAAVRAGRHVLTVHALGPAATTVPAPTPNEEASHHAP